MNSFYYEVVARLYKFFTGLGMVAPENKNYWIFFFANFFYDCVGENLPDSWVGVP